MTSPGLTLFLFASSIGVDICFVKVIFLDEVSVVQSFHLHIIKCFSQLILPTLLTY